MSMLATLIFSFALIASVMIAMIVTVSACVVWVHNRCQENEEHLKEYKTHRSEFEQWLKYKDKTMRGDY